MDIEILEQEFEPKEIKKRKGPGRKYLDYVETHSVIKSLNTAFSHNWSFSIEKYEIVDDHVIVLGKLTAEEDDVLNLTERMFQTRDPMSLNKEMASAIIAVLEYMQKGNGKPDESSQEVSGLHRWRIRFKRNSVELKFIAKCL
ncbi:hypothetical protein GF312_11640 [Candidatus Poribacteria bacterium]|nr:hypothetical protein [Candidatus Poribacteria bacterium]